VTAAAAVEVVSTDAGVAIVAAAISIAMRLEVPLPIKAP
jgi:hypothetical protein